MPKIIKIVPIIIRGFILNQIEMKCSINKKIKSRNISTRDQDQKVHNMIKSLLFHAYHVVQELIILNIRTVLKIIHFEG